MTFTFATSNHFVILATASHIVIFAAFSHFVPDPKMHSEWVYILGHFAQVHCFSQLLSFRLGEFCKHHPPAATLVSSPWFTWIWWFTKIAHKNVIIHKKHKIVAAVPMVWRKRGSRRHSSDWLLWIWRHDVRVWRFVQSRSSELPERSDKAASADRP